MTASTREDLRRMLLTPEDLAGFTGTTWQSRPAPAGDAPASATGCPALDSAVLASNTGLVDTGPVDLSNAAGDLIEENIAYDTRSAEHVRQLHDAIATCPAMTVDGTRYPVKRMDLGSDVAGFRVFVGGKSQSVVLAGHHGDYVVELIASDHALPDGHYRALLDLAYQRVDNPR